MARIAKFMDNWAQSSQGIRLAHSASALCGCALTFTLVAFFWWNLQPESVGLIDLSSDNLEVTRRGPGWPIPSFTGRAQWSRADTPARQLFRRQAAGGPIGGRPAPHNSWLTRIVPNAVFGALLLSALLANIARGRLEPAGDLSDEFEHDQADA